VAEAAAASQTKIGWAGHVLKIRNLPPLGEAFVQRRLEKATDEFAPERLFALEHKDCLALGDLGGEARETGFRGVEGRARGGQFYGVRAGSLMEVEDEDDLLH
jgi:hypothetical protein